MRKARKKKNLVELERRLEEWALKQFEKYVRIHKRNEKELRYIA